MALDESCAGWSQEQEDKKYAVKNNMVVKAAVGKEFEVIPERLALKSLPDLIGKPVLGLDGKTKIGEVVSVEDFSEGIATFVIRVDPGMIMKSYKEMDSLSIGLEE